MEVLCSLNRLRPKFWPVALGKACKISGNYINTFGLSIMGEYAPTENLSTHRRLVIFENQRPTIGQNSFIAPSATVVGGVELAQAIAIMYGVVIRGEQMKVRVGESVYIGDYTVISPSLSSSRSNGQCNIGSRVTIGTGVTLNECTLGDECTVEQGSVVLSGATIGSRAVIGAGSVVPSGTNVPANQYWSGSPAKFVRDLSQNEIQRKQEELNRLLDISDRHNYWHDLSIAEREILKMTLSRDPLGDEMDRREEYRF